MFRRNLDPSVRVALADTPVVLLVGARQTGKSTLIQQLIADGYPATYRTLDDLATLAAAKADPVGFVAAHDGPLAVDEVQRAPELLLAIKSAVDRDRGPGRFLLTGSANVLVLPRVADLLVGRMEVLTLWPLSQGELRGRRETFVDELFGDGPRPPAGRVDRAEVLRAALIGGYPEAVNRPVDERRAAWFAAYLTTILQRDVRDLANVDGLALLPRLLSVIASRSAGLLNVTDVSRTVGIPVTTLKRYLALLEAIFLVRTIPAWSSSHARRLVRTPKIDLCDPGLLAHALGLDTRRVAADPTLAGPLLETFVAAEVRKQLGWSVTRAAELHFRMHAGQEVDVVLEDPSGRVAGIEVKASASLSASDLRGLRALQEAAGDRFVRGVVLYLGDEFLPFGERLVAAPVTALWGG